MNSGTAKAPGTLADVLTAFRAAWSSCGQKVPILFGRKHLSQTLGNPPRIVFVPDDFGSLGDPISSGRHAASWTHGCEFRVRAKAGNEEERIFEHVEALASKVIGILAVLGSGRITWGEVSDTSPTDVYNLGAELAFRFTFAHNIPQFEGIWNLPTPAESSAKDISDTRTLAGYTPATDPGAPETDTGTADLDISLQPTE